MNNPEAFPRACKITKNINSTQTPTLISQNTETSENNMTIDIASSDNSQLTPLDLADQKGKDKVNEVMAGRETTAACIASSATNMKGSRKGIISNDTEDVRPSSTATNSQATTFLSCFFPIALVVHFHLQCSFAISVDLYFCVH